MFENTIWLVLPDTSSSSKEDNRDPSLKDEVGRNLEDFMTLHNSTLGLLRLYPLGSFVTSLLELKLDINTMFEWQQHSQASADVPLPKLQCQM